jgi:hypothetical protein
MVTSILLLLGTLLVFIANRGEVNGWEPLDIFLTLGLVGYVLIISAIAWFLLTFLNKHLDDIV